MDPIANLNEQRELAQKLQAILDSPGFLSGAKQDEVIAYADRLAILVLSLDEWRRAGGFDPYQQKGGSA